MIETPSAKPKNTDDNLPSVAELVVQIEAIKTSLKQTEESLKQAEHDRNEYRKLYELVLMELERTRRHLFGKKSERVPDEQLPLAFLEISEKLKALEQEVNAPIANSQREQDKAKTKKKRKPHGRQILPEHLPVERIELPVPLEVKKDPKAYKKIGEDISQTLERRPATLIRVQVVRPKFAKKGNDEAGIIAATLPTKPIARGLAGPGLLAHVIVSKYQDHLPLNRQEKIFAREGIELNRSTLCGWIEQCAGLSKFVVDAMEKDAMKAHCIATDATGVLVQAPNVCRRGHFFVLVADRDHVLYKYTRHHDGQAVKDLLGDYEGYILADAHVVYDQLFRGTDKRKECGCWSHSRRYFFDAMSTDPDRATVGLKLIRKLFDIERDIKDKPHSIKKEIRKEKSKPIMDLFFEWCDAQKPLVLDDTPIQAAIRYATNQREALCCFLEDGRLSIHNNVSELQLRRQVIGRRNWLFLGSEDGGEWNGVFTSLIASCHLHDIEPWAYIRDLLVLINDWPQHRALELSPKYWKKTLENTDAQKRLEANVFRQISAVGA